MIDRNELRATLLDRFSVREPTLVPVEPPKVVAIGRTIKPMSRRDMYRANNFMEPHSMPIFQGEDEELEGPHFFKPQEDPQQKIGMLEQIIIKLLMERMQ